MKNVLEPRGQMIDTGPHWMAGKESSIYFRFGNHDTVQSPYNTFHHNTTLSCAGAILKDRSVCRATSRLKSLVCITQNTPLKK